MFRASLAALPLLIAVAFDGHAAPLQRVALVCSTCSEHTMRSYRVDIGPQFAKAGLVEGKDFEFVLVRPKDTSLDRLDIPDLVARIQAAKPSVVLPMDVRSNTVVGSLRDVPVVLGAAYADAGIVGDQANRTRNITGFVYSVENMDVKRLELLRELAPSAKRVGLWVQRDLPNLDRRLAELRRAGMALGMELREFHLDDPSEQGKAKIAEIKQSGTDAFLVLAGNLWRREWVGVARSHRLITVYPYGWTAEAGGPAAYEQAWWKYSDVVGYVRQILAGKRPSDLPIQQQSSQQLILNAAAVRELGLTLTPSLTVRADRVIGR